MGFNAAALLLKARACDRALWEWHCPGISYEPVQSLLAINGSLETLSGTNNKELEILFERTACIVPRGGIVAELNNRIYFARVDKVIVDGCACYHVMPAWWEGGSFWRNIGMAFKHTRNHGHMHAVSMHQESKWERLPEELKDKWINTLGVLLGGYLHATFFADVTSYKFGIARRPMAARSGWSGIRYEVAELTRRLAVPRKPSVGSHATPCRHWVRATLYAHPKTGKLIFRKAHQRGDSTRGEVIKDWVREMGLAADGSIAS